MTNTHDESPPLTEKAARVLAEGRIRDWDAKDLYGFVLEQLVEDYLADGGLFADDWAFVFGEERQS